MEIWEKAISPIPFSTKYHHDSGCSQTVNSNHLIISDEYNKTYLWTVTKNNSFKMSVYIKIVRNKHKNIKGYLN